MEFRIVKVTSGVAIFNYQELKQQLQEKLNDYKGYLVTTENLSQSKTDRATLNKVKKAISDERIKVKNEVLKLYNETFEPQCKELTSLIDDVVLSIDNQIKAQEGIGKAEKKREIESLYNTIISDVNFIPDTKRFLELIWGDKWLNKSCGIDEIKRDIEQAINNVRNDLSVIDMTFASQLDNSEVKVEYFKSFNLSMALKEFIYRKELKEKVINQTDTLVEKGANQTENQEEEVTVILSIHATKSKILTLGEYLKANNINYVQIS